MLKTDLVDKFQIAANKDKVIFDSFQYVLVMLTDSTCLICSKFHNIDSMAVLMNVKLI
jgi:hypothetical protein